MKRKLSILFAALLCAAMSFAGTFVQTDLANIKSTDVVLIVATRSDGSYAMSNDKGTGNPPTAVAVTVSGTSITTEATNILWNITYDATASTFTVNVADGTAKLYCTNTNNGVRVGSGDANTFNITSNYIYNTTHKRYLGVFNKQDWRCYTSNTTDNIKNQTFAFYVKEVAPVPATGISLNKASLTLDKGATEQLTATLTPTDATTEVVWATDNAAVATVANGLVTAVGVGTANITATVTPAEETSYTATCVVTVVAAPDAPTFTVTDEVFEGSMNVTLAAAEGMKIYYTTNGDVPTTAATEYTAPFEITATTTVKAIAYDEANTKASVVATKTYTKAMTCAEANAAAANTVVNLNTVTVVYVNGANTYVADATGTTLVYKSDFGLKAGDIVKGIKGTISIFNGLPEIVPTVTLTDLTVTTGGLQPMPTVLTTVPTAALVNQYVKFEGVKFDQDYANYSTKTNANITVGEGTLVVRNNFTIDFGDIKKDYMYDVIGFVAVYNSTVQLYPVAINDITMHGSYTVGTTDCNYASLAAAFTAYNTKAAAGMVTGDVTLQIASDLTEAKNVGIQNPTDYTLTITVDKAEARTISFSQAGDNAGPSGNICIGCDMTLSHTSASVETKNIIIDGAYNGSEESYLTIKSVSGCHKLNGPVLIYGNVTNCTVKNCNLIAENGAGSSLFLVNIRTQNATAYTPTDITIENNYLYAITGNADQGIQLTKGSGTTTPKNIKIEDNTIIARTRGIFINGAENATIFGNEVQVLQTNLGSISYGIWGFANTTGVFNVNNNVITALTTGANESGHGIVGICAGAGNWYIRNNYVSGFQVASTAANGITLTGIQGSAAAGVLVIEHNTVALADQTNAVANPDLSKVCMIKPLSTNATVRNNLVYSAEADFNNALISPAGTLAGNVYCTQSYIGSADSIKTLVDYKAIHEATAKTVASVEFANLAKGNLDLAGASDGDVNLGVDALEAVPTDINGTVRAAYTYAGAYEGTELTKPGPVTGMDEIEEIAAGVQKIVRDGQVLILRDGKTYNMMGQVVE